MFTLASLVLMFTHSLKAKSSYHRLLVVSHSLLPSSSRDVWKGWKRLVWCFPVEKHWHGLPCRWRGWVAVTAPLKQGVMWLWVCARVCACLGIYVRSGESVLEWIRMALYSLLLSRAPYAGPHCPPTPPSPPGLSSLSTLAAQISTMCRQGSSAGLHTPLDMGLTSPVCASLARLGPLWLPVTPTARPGFAS